MKYAVLETCFFELLAADPTDVVQEGRFYHNSTSHAFKFYNGTAWVAAMSDPMTTRGDMIYRGAAANSRLAVGGANTVLTTNGTDPSWSTLTIPFGTDVKGQGLVSGGSGALAWAPKQYLINAVSNADYAVLDNDGYSTILMTLTVANKTVTLPTAADNTGRIITIKKMDSTAYLVLIKGEAAGETIDGVSGTTGKTLYVQYDYMTVMCTGTVWLVIDKYLAPVICHRNGDDTGASLNNNVDSYVNFASSIVDTHNSWSAAVGAYNAGTGLWATSQPGFHIPATGKYTISTTISVQTAPATDFTLSLYDSVGAYLVQTVTVPVANGTISATVNGVHLIAGNYVYVNAQWRNGSGSTSYTTTDYRNTFTIFGLID